MCLRTYQVTAPDVYLPHKLQWLSVNVKFASVQIQHQYTLTGEQGPAHKKTFFVDLKLGEEEYAASGASIKKTQHAAAAIALEKTQYKHPPPKPPRKINGGSKCSSVGFHIMDRFFGESDKE